MGLTGQLELTRIGPPKLTAAVISALLLSPTAVRAGHPEAQHLNAWLIGSAALLASLQGTTIVHGTTARTASSTSSLPVHALGNLSAVESDPWQELRMLGHNWDGQGAEPVSRAALDHAKDFVASIAALGSVFEPFAHPNGSVGLEAHKADKSAFMIVSPKDRFAYVLRVGDTVHRGNDVEERVMRRVLELLF